MLIVENNEIMYLWKIRDYGNLCNYMKRWFNGFIETHIMIRISCETFLRMGRMWELISRLHSSLFNDSEIRNNVYSNSFWVM